MTGRVGRTDRAGKSIQGNISIPDGFEISLALFLGELAVTIYVKRLEDFGKIAIAERIAGRRGGRRRDAGRVLGPAGGSGGQQHCGEQESGVQFHMTRVELNHCCRDRREAGSLPYPRRGVRKVVTQG